MTADPSCSPVTDILRLRLNLYYTFQVQMLEAEEIEENIRDWSKITVLLFYYSVNCVQRGVDIYTTYAM